MISVSQTIQNLTVSHPTTDKHDLEYLSLKSAPPFSHSFVETSSLLSISIGSSPFKKHYTRHEAVFHSDHENVAYVGGSVG